MPLRAQDTVRARLLGTIGENARTPFFLSQVSGFALDDSGRVYVADFQDPHVVVFAPDGRHLATIGRKGEGPGEFRAPTGPVIGADGMLYVRNMSKVSRFRRDVKTGLATVFDSTFDGPPMAPWLSKWPSVIDRAGRFHFPQTVNLDADKLTHVGYRRYGAGGRKLDSIGVPMYATSRSDWSSVRISEGSGKLVFGVNVVPFHPVPVWAVTPAGTVISGAANKYELVETDSAGRVVRTISRAVPAVRIPAAERDDSIKALKRRIDSLPVPIERVQFVAPEVREMRIPETYPFYTGVVAAPSGDLWVRRWLPAAASPRTVVDVLTAAGAYRHTVILPMNCAREPGMVVRGSYVVCMEVDRETGGESVVVARIN
jgi:hypothetical protein